MIVARLHKKLFEATALDMDRQIRSHFVEKRLRADYLKDLDKDPRILDTPDFHSQIDFLIRSVDAGVELKGKFGFVKSILKRIMRPFLYHEACIDRMTIEQIVILHNKFRCLNNIFEEMHASLREDLERKCEMIRAEVAEEVRRPSPSGATGERADSASQRIAPGSKLVLGTVAVKRPGYLHIDPTLDGSDQPDSLPVAPGTLAELVVANALEFFPACEVRDRLLPYWASLLQPGARLTVIADDFGAAGDRFRAGQIDFAELTEIFFGDGGPVRRSAYTPELLREYVTQAGLTRVSVSDRRQRPDARAYGFELTAFGPTT